MLIFLMERGHSWTQLKACNSRPRSKVKTKTKAAKKIQVKPFSRSSLGQSAVAVATTLDSAEKPLGGTEA